MVGCLSTVPVLSSIAALGWVWGGAVKHSLPKRREGGAITYLLRLLILTLEIKKRLSLGLLFQKQMIYWFSLIRLHIIAR